MPRVQRTALSIGLLLGTVLFCRIGLPGEMETKVHRLYEAVSPHVVAYSSDQSIHLGAGVVIDSSGLALGGYNPSLILTKQNGIPIYVTFPDGRKTEGELVGWSREWNLTMVKLNGPEPWPHVKLHRKGNLHLGQYVVGLGYHAASPRAMEPKPFIQLGNVTHSGQTWFTTTCVHDVVFDLDGKLVGLTSKWAAGLEDDEATHCRAEVASALLRLLSSGTDLDAIRLTKASYPDLLGNTPPGDVKNQPQTSASEVASITTVRLRAKSNQEGWSGVVVSPTGHIATCAHVDIVAGEHVSVELSDGRDVQAVVVGVNRVTDVGLLKIDGNGPYAYARLGDSRTFRDGANCLVAGFPYGHDERKPMVQDTTVVESKWQPPSSLLWTTSKTRIRGGTSGGGVFDTDGRLIGIHLGSSGFANRQLRVEALKAQLGLLLKGKPDGRLPSSTLDELRAVHRIDTKGPNLEVVVEVRQNGKQQARGTVVSEDGLVVTKLSQLSNGPIRFRLANGETYEASIEKTSREHDLALLRVSAKTLPAATWSKEPSVAEGASVCVPVGPSNIRFGVVSMGPRTIPDQPTAGIINVKQTPGGVQFRGGDWQNEFYWIDPSKFPLSEGDIIESVDGYPVQDLQGLAALFGGTKGKGKLGTNPGDTVKLRIRRGQESRSVEYLVPSLEGLEETHQSKRCYGFSNAFDVDCRCTSEICGAVVLNSSVEAIGIVIAFRSPEQIHVIPASVIQEFIADDGSQR